MNIALKMTSTWGQRMACVILVGGGVGGGWGVEGEWGKRGSYPPWISEFRLS